jgi:hypothetical protein
MTCHLDPIKRLIDACHDADEIAVVAVLVAHCPTDELTCLSTIEWIASDLGKTDKWVHHALRRLELARSRTNKPLLVVYYCEDMRFENGQILAVYRFTLLPPPPAGESGQ